ncbi:MAG: hypothetical protein IKA19_02410 [Muribaculaceae bacterium]|nr:hypothetical protein [Muribaculaceae bacterium]MBR1963540.1 hypothetical protein [Muribaculaceae bacterium]
MPYNYNERNAHERDYLLTFDEVQHIYTLNGRRMESVTTIVEDCFPKFDAEYWAARKAPALGLTPEQLIAQWEEKACQARELGTCMHEKIEHHYMGISSESDETFDLFLQFAKKYVLQPYRTEWRIFYEEYGIAGTLDFLEYRDGQFNIYDWKRSEKLVVNGVVEKESRYRKTALPPIAHLSDTTFYHYALQVSIYRYILEKKYGINVSQSRLAVFHPSYKCPHVIDIPYLRKEVELVLEHLSQRQ